MNYGQKCHSITFVPKQPEVVTDTVLFVDFDSKDTEIKTNIHPTYEFYPRTHYGNQEVYIHGMDERWRVPEEIKAEDVLPTPGSCKRLVQVASHVANKWVFDDSDMTTSVYAPPKSTTPKTDSISKTLVEQACYMPLVLDGEPLLGYVPGIKGAVVAAGNAEWGITLGPATGHIATQLVIGENPHLNLERFTCERFPVGYTIEKRDELLLQSRQKTPQVKTNTKIES